MGAALIPIALGATAASTALSTAGTFMAGRERSQAAAFEAEQGFRRSQVLQTAAAQSEAQRRDQLVSSLETIAVLRGGRGLSADSPTGDAIAGKFIADSERDLRTERLNILMQSDAARMGAELALRRKRTAMVAGEIGAAGELAGGLTKIGGLATGKIGLAKGLS